MMKNRIEDILAKLKSGSRFNSTSYAHPGMLYPGSKNPSIKLIISEEKSEENLSASAKLKGMFKVTLGILYFISLVYFLTVLLT